MRPGKRLDRARGQCARIVHAATMLLTVVGTVGLIAAPPQRASADVEEWLRLLWEHRAGVLDDAARQISGWQWAQLQPVLQELHRRAHPTVVLRSAALLSDIAFAIPSEQRRLGNLSGGTILADDGRVQGAGSMDGHLAAARRLLDALPRSGSLDVDAGRRPDPDLPRSGRPADRRLQRLEEARADGQRLDRAVPLDGEDRPAARV
jgi:hypothetical protein